jgi:death on curing protein
VKEPIWLTEKQVLDTHHRQFERFGGATGIRDAGALASVLDRPINRWMYEQADLPELAAAYAFGLARSHPFVDGNKRVSLLAMAGFLVLNGALFEADPEEATAMMLALAAGEIDEAGLARWIRDNCSVRRAPRRRS